MGEIERVLRAHHGVCTTAQLIAGGFTKHAIARAVSRRDLERAHRGVFVDPQLPGDVRQAVRVGGRLTCVSAARLHGLRVLHESPVLHVGVSPHATRLRGLEAASYGGGRGAGLRLHWNLPASHAGSAASPIAGIEDCLVDLLGCLPELDALCTLDSARETVEWMSLPPLLDHAGFGRVLARLPANLRLVAGRSITGSQSVGETVARERFRQAGIRARAQVSLPGGAWADLLIGDRLVFEVDGEAPHSRPGAFDRDRARWAWLKAIGYAHVSFSHAQVVRDWASVESTVRMLMSRGEHVWPARPNSGVPR